MHGSMGMCRCGCHIFAKIIGFLALISAILFFYVAWTGRLVWGFDTNYYFQSVIVLSLVAWGTKMCGCCKKMMMAGMMGKGMCGNCGTMGCGGCGGKGMEMKAGMMCAHGSNCTCGHDDCKSCKA